MENINNLSYQELLDLYKNICSYIKELEGEVDKYNKEEEDGSNA